MISNWPILSFTIFLPLLGSLIILFIKIEQKNNIRCNSVHPGSILTPMVHTALETLAGIKLMEQDDPESARKAMGIGEPIDVANMVLFLASEESKHINGAELVIDNSAAIGDTSL